MQQLVTFLIHILDNSCKEHYHIVYEENVQVNEQCSLDLHLYRRRHFFVLVLQEVLSLKMIPTGSLLFFLILFFHVDLNGQEFRERAWYLISF